MRRCVALLVVVPLGLLGCGREGPEQDSPEVAEAPTPREETTSERVAPAAPQEQPSPEAVEPAAPAMPTLAQLEQALRDENPRRRLEAVWSLPKRDDLPAPERARLLLEALEGEISEPTTGPPVTEGAYLPASDFLKLHYTRTLGALGPEAIDSLREATASDKPEVRARAFLALGYAGQHDVIPQLRELLRTSEHWQVRNDAAFLLGELRAREAVPELKEALRDSYKIIDEINGRRHEFYPVRQQAQGALKQLGFTIERGEGVDEFRVLGP